MLHADSASATVVCRLPTLFDQAEMVFAMLQYVPLLRRSFQLYEELERETKQVHQYVLQDGLCHRTALITYQTCQTPCCCSHCNPGIVGCALPRTVVFACIWLSGAVVPCAACEWGLALQKLYTPTGVLNIGSHVFEVSVIAKNCTSVPSDAGRALETMLSGMPPSGILQHF